MNLKHLAHLCLAVLLAGCGALPQAVSQSDASLQADAKLMTFHPKLPVGQGERPVVLFSYLPIDDPMEYHIPYYLNALEETTSSRLYNVAFSDAKGPDNTFAHLITSDHSDQVVSPKAAPGPGLTELSTNHPDTLAAAVSWAYSSYPGRFKAFSYLGHGGGALGIATDYTPGKGMQPRVSLSVAEFGEGLKRGLKGRKLDLIHLHSCLMANVEAAYELRDVAQVLFASENVVGTGSNEQEGTQKPTKLLNTLLQEANPDARRIAREMVIQMNPSQNPYGFSTAAAVDLDRIEIVKSAVNVLARDLIAALPQRRSAILDAYQQVPFMHYMPNYPCRDLWTFCNKVSKLGDPVLEKDALAVKQALRSVLIHAKDSELDAANGLSIFMPNSESQLNVPLLASRFAKETQWDEFVTQIVQGL